VRGHGDAAELVGRAAFGAEASVGGHGQGTLYGSQSEGRGVRGR
jgi:hypothetical protein